MKLNTIDTKPPMLNLVGELKSKGIQPYYTDDRNGHYTTDRHQNSTSMDYNKYSSMEDMKKIY